MGAVANKIFEQHQHLADYYANKIWNEENLGIEKADLKQELKLRLFLSIKAYAKKWKEYRETGRNRPVPLQFYIKTTLLNKSRDIIKEINAAKFHTSSQFTYDRGMEADELIIEKTDVVIGTQRLSALFRGQELRVYKLLVLSDFDPDKVKKTYRGKKSAIELTDSVLNKLRVYLNENKSIVSEFEVFTN